MKKLEIAWTFHTGALKKSGAATSRSSFESNPIFWNGLLFLDTPFDQVFALDGKTGRQKWSFDPNVNRNGTIGIVTSRGVSIWHSSKELKGPCASHRVFVSTLDRRLIALDAKTGIACKDFGLDGTVDLTANLKLKDTTWYEFTSPPTIVGNAVIVGSSSGDNQAIEVPTGVVRAFDARSGNLIWAWEPLPWAASTHPATGSGGSWSVISADPQRNLVFVPTGSPSLDFYGVQRAGENRDANSVVALEASTGKRVWGFQVVHHDLWDYDVAAEPLLFMFQGRTPAIAVNTKMGMLFVLDRMTGQPLYPVHERPVPQSDIPGERTAATQPFSDLTPLAPLSFTSRQVFGKTEVDRKFCEEKVAALVNKGIYTPIGLKSTLLYPGSIGGVNWGSPAFDPDSGIMYVNVNRLAYDVRLIPRENHSPSLYTKVSRRLREFGIEHGLISEDLPVEQRFRAPDGAGKETNTQYGSPYLMFREPLLSPSGLPCNPPPWGELVAFSLNTGRKTWSRPLGTMIPAQNTGSISVGGPITFGDLVLSAGTVEPLIRAYRKSDGSEVWQGHLPVPAQSTPMTYMIDSRQYVVICAGGHGAMGTALGDQVIAFALPEASLPKSHNSRGLAVK